MNLRKLLFYIDNNKIKSYIFNNEKYELISYKGEEYYSNDIDSFWDWLEKSISLSKKDVIDICVISNNDLLNFKKISYNFIEKSTWNYEEIKLFLPEINHSGILLSNNNIDKKITNKINTFSDYLNKKQFNSLFNLFTIPPSNLFTEKENNNPEIVEKKGILSEYYKKKTEKIVK